MQINELEIAKTLRYRGPVDWHRLFKKNGWQFLGMGTEAAVGEHPTKNYVVRIFPRDTPYMDFVNLVRAHQKNPHFPKFSRYVRPVPGTILSYTRMEKLEPIQEVSLLEAPYLNQMAYLYFQCQKMKLQFHEDFEEEIAARLHKIANNELTNADAQLTVWQKLENPKPIGKKLWILFWHCFQQEHIGPVSWTCTAVISCCETAPL